MDKIATITPRVISLREYSLAGRVAAYIREHAFDESELLQYTLLERHFGVCTTNLTKAFKSRYGQSVHEFIMKTRHEKICELMINTNRAIKEIAIEAGYTELSNFSRDFTKMAGVPPTVYRQQQNIHYPMADSITMQESS